MKMPDHNALLVILTGAGISKESGLSTFRDPDGVWAKVDLEEVATPEAFQRNPDRVHEFYNHRRRGLQEPDIRPNGAHEALARLEQGWPGEVLLVTQNVDDLHERAGSRNLIHMHGELMKIRCELCGEGTGWKEDLGIGILCPFCGYKGGLRPDVVWFGEIPYAMDRILEHLSRCGLFVSIGTSGAVYPAAGFAALVRDQGLADTVEINLEPSEGASLFTERRYGPASMLVPQFVDELLGTLT
ncbi:NAD-dependent deacylase [Aestuariispira insulae]|uniref:NAD-dependent protein deacylase n=1 Tax=Aestuariispira insulae TaxID=1461337 RepID=A0A3D9HP45_9PROT|nr:NAD-dependent deacylase [Aestuariispira insulae]RED51260.1 NAD-dependent deacetylase [Aestuariispira insulae]